MQEIHDPLIDNSLEWKIDDHRPRFFLFHPKCHTSDEKIEKDKDTTISEDMDDDIEILCARVDTIVDRCEDERNYDREINNRREKWENYLKYDHLGEDNPLQTLTHMRIRKYIEMFVEDLENPEAPTKSLFEKRMHRLWCLSIGIGSFLMEDTVSVSEDRESEITILR